MSNILISFLLHCSLSPGSVCLHDFFATPTFLFAVFELARSELFDALNRSVTFSEKRARPIMRQLFVFVPFPFLNLLLPFSFDGVHYMHTVIVLLYKNKSFFDLIIEDDCSS